MPSPSRIRIPKATYHRRFNMASKEIVDNHYHHCWKCGKEHPGYAPKCKEPKELMCGGCLAGEFNAG